MKPKLIGNLEKGGVFVISAPAGTGKTTLVNLLKKELVCITESVSYTTRKPRVGEIDGKDYHFIDQEQFKKKIEQKQFLEWAEVFGDYYGTSKEQIEEIINTGNHAVLVIDTQGAKQVRKKIESCHIFIFPPNMHELQYRLHARKSESEEKIQKRLSWAKKEMAAAIDYDYYLINDDIEVARKVLGSIFIAQEHKIKNKKISFIDLITKG